MERWFKKGTLKRSSQEPEYFAVNSSHIDNHSNNENDTNEITPKKKCRKYDESYISLGFMNNNDNPQCVICSKVLPNSSMAPAKMRRHLESVHDELKEKNVEFFIRKRDELLKSINCMVQTTKTVNEKTTEASYLVSYQIAQRGEAYTIAESLIKPCAMEMVKCMLDEKSAKEISKIQLSNDTVANRINDLAADIQNELIFRLKSCKFALKMDEYPQLSQKAVLALLPFATTYMCETGFSTYVSTKTKYRNRLDAEPNMLLKLSSIKPNIKNICNNKKQFHASY
ncbi:zinc finger BED domain-containing protein 5-like [Sipha flava]|jgi:hypothetical protein|uniref:Zinc finger BED domain-containing protein 5-like n=1 Tax=Sipha flava TaxID=143950 RepID=A0A8B8GJY2_9HEMI|nr:zinc finger BED domain-containing protein 5-like [Sipha flava]